MKKTKVRKAYIFAVNGDFTACYRTSTGITNFENIKGQAEGTLKWVLSLFQNPKYIVIGEPQKDYVFEVKNSKLKYRKSGNKTIVRNIVNNLVIKSLTS